MTMVVTLGELARYHPTLGGWAGLYSSRCTAPKTPYLPSLPTHHHYDPAS